MLTFAKHTKGQVDQYTLDHRATGRSNFLECQVSDTDGAEISYAEYLKCIKDLLFQTDNHPEAYSVTSAANDIEFLVKQLHGDKVDAFAYGMSCGTYFVTGLSRVTQHR